MLRLRNLEQPTIIICLLALVFTGCLRNTGDLTLDQRAQALDKQLICPICPTETIDQSQVQLAKQMKNIVRERLSLGASEQEILDFFVSRYGEDVLAAPPTHGFSLTVWIVGALALPSAILALILTLRSMRRATTAKSLSSEENLSISGINQYLSRADKEISDFLDTNSTNDRSDEV